MAEIIPAILPEDFYEIEKKVRSVFRVCPNIQIDICDGVYVPSRTWPFVIKDDKFFADIMDERIGMPEWEHVNYELDLMIKNPNKRFEEFIKLGPSRLIFHFRSFANTEVANEFFKNLDQFYKNNIEIGLAISAEENLSEIKEIIPEIHFIQIMGIKVIGVQGSPLDEEYFEKVLEQISAIKKLYPEMPVSVDGSVSLNTKDVLLEAGADRLVSGSAIFQSADPLATIEQFKA
ncbi:MAG TPA: hypothetical protein PK886_01010 [Candidatus Paceibacterota bacterium]|nr:hypothetical protein [Candidatus Paceibacterota bacterium]